MNDPTKCQKLHIDKVSKNVKTVSKVCQNYSSYFKFLKRIFVTGQKETGGLIQKSKHSFPMHRKNVLQV